MIRIIKKHKLTLIFRAGGSARKKRARHTALADSVFSPMNQKHRNRIFLVLLFIAIPFFKLFLWRYITEELSAREKAYKRHKVRKLQKEETLESAFVSEVSVVIRKNLGKRSERTVSNCRRHYVRKALFIKLP